jgi:hypothetical protein
MPHAAIPRIIIPYLRECSEANAHTCVSVICGEIFKLLLKTLLRYEVLGSMVVPAR